MSYPRALHDGVSRYVEILERQQAQLVAGLQEMYRRMQNGHGWIGAPLDEAAGHPLTHDILESLGVLRKAGNGIPETVEDGMMGHQLFGEGLDLVQSHDFMNLESSCPQSPPRRSTFNSAPFQQIHYNDCFWLDGMPPTPSDNSMFSSSPQHETAFNEKLALNNVASASLTRGDFPAQPRVPRPLKRKPNLSLSGLSSLQTQRSMNPAQLQRQSWHASPVSYDIGCTDIMHRYAEPLNCEAPTMRGLQFPTPASTFASINLADWQEPVEVDFTAFLNQAVV